VDSTARRIEVLGAAAFEMDAAQGCGTDCVGKSFLGNNIHVAREQTLQVYLQSRQIQEGSAWVERDKKVHVAVRSLSSARNRTENSDVSRAGRCCGSDDRVAQFSYPFAQEHT
jgi:hypothetical protein